MMNTKRNCWTMTIKWKVWVWSTDRNWRSLKLNSNRRMRCTTGSATTAWTPCTCRRAWRRKRQWSLAKCTRRRRSRWTKMLSAHATSLKQRCSKVCMNSCVNGIIRSKRCTMKNWLKMGNLSPDWISKYHSWIISGMRRNTRSKG